jgi:methyl-accepting chemotaxis protein
VPSSRDRPRPAQLSQQLVESGFPRGVGVASTTSFVLLVLIAGFTAAYLTTTGPLSLFGVSSPAMAVPAGVLETQQQAAESLSQAIATSATGSSADLRVVAKSGVLDTPDTGQVLTTLSQTYPGWRGLAVLDAATLKPIGAHGEPVAAEGLRDIRVDNVTVQPVVHTGGTPMVLTTVPLTGPRSGQLLVVSTALREASTVLDKEVRQRLQLITTDGTVVDSRGPALDKADAVALDLVTQAASAAAAGSSGVLTGASAPAAGGTGEVAPVVSYAPVSAEGLDGSLGLSLVSVSRVPLETTPQRRPGLIPAGALLALAVAGLILLRRVVVLPIRRLRSDALAVASGELGTAVRQSRVQEVRSLTVALDRCRARLRRRKRSGKPAEATISAQVVVILVAVALLGWSAALAMTLGRQSATASPTVVSEHSLRATRSADTLRRSLTEGLSDLQAVARLNNGKPVEELRPMLDELAASETRFRSIYLADAGGAVLLSSGRQALRDSSKLPDGEGLHQHNTSGRVPIVFAYTHLADTGRVLVGEFDVTRMSALMQPAGGRVRVVDEGNRTIADTEGYLAFEELTDPALRRSVASALAGGDTRETTGSTLVAAQGLATKGSAAALRWTVVAEQPFGALGVPDNTVRDGARVAALLTAVVAVLLFGWHQLMVLNPLRRVTTAARRVAKGDTDLVVYPQRQDEIGTIASCLEICRQGLVEGTERLGDVRRPRGAATDPTELMSRIKAEAAEKPPAPRQRVRHGV